MADFKIDENDIVMEHINRGPEGSAVRIKHVPTGLAVSTAPSRDTISPERIRSLMRELAQKVARGAK